MGLAKPNEVASPQPVGAVSSKIARNASFLALGQVCTTALAIVFSAALGRALGASDFGLYFLVTSMTGFAFVFVEWGQPPVVIRETARDPGIAGKLLGSALVLRLAMAAAAAIPLLLITFPLGYDGRTRWLLALFFVTNVPVSLSAAFGMVFRGRDKMDRDALVSVLTKGIALAFVVLALTHRGGLAAIAVSQGLAALVVLGAARWMYDRLRLPRISFDREAARSLIIYGTPIIVMGTATAVQPYLDAVILSKLVPADAMGWYGVSKTILGTLQAPAVILGAASFPQLSRAATDAGHFRDAVRSALRPMLLIGALGAAGTFLFAGTVVQIIYGKKHYDPAGMILQVFSPGMFLLFIDVLLGNILLAAGRAKGFAAAKIASVIVSTVLDFLLIPWFQTRYGNGGVGVVVSYALSEFVVFGGAIALMPPKTLSLRYAVDGAKAAVSAAVTVLLLRAVPGLPPWAGIPLCVVLFAGVAFALGLVQRSDLALFGALLRRGKPQVEPATGP